MPSEFDGAFTEGSSVLSWMACNTRKYGNSGGGDEVFTFLSTSTFGKKHKAPQEFLEGTAKEKEVVGLMMAEVERIVGGGSIELKAAKLQLWGAGRESQLHV